MLASLLYNIFLSADTVTFEIEQISKKPLVLDFIFIVLLCCFSLTFILFSYKRRMLSSMADELIHVKARHSLFYVEVGNELYSKLLLCVQTCLLVSIFMYYSYSHDRDGSFNSVSDATLSIGISFSLLLAFLLYKWMAYSIIGKTFFNKDGLSLWLNNFMSVISYLGVILFLPILLMCYIDFLYIYCFYFVLFCIFLSTVVIIYKSYTLFFNSGSLLIYLFLYLCGQEILPLFLLYKGLVYSFNVVKNSALWL